MPRDAHESEFRYQSASSKPNVERKHASTQHKHSLGSQSTRSRRVSVYQSGPVTAMVVPPLGSQRELRLGDNCEQVGRAKARRIPSPICLLLAMLLNTGTLGPVAASSGRRVPSLKVEKDAICLLTERARPT